MNDQDKVQSVIDFWFAGIGNGFNVRQQAAIWYGGGKTLDDQISRRFGSLLESALNGKLAHWHLPELQYGPLGLLAYVIIIDQFSRNIFRGDAKAFSGDTVALTAALEGVSANLDEPLSYIQRTFLYMPLMHSESLNNQKKCVQLFEQLLQEVPLEGKTVIADNLDYAKQHLMIIEQFGRFPHRNSVLGRVSTQHELDYLGEGGARFGQ